MILSHRLIFHLPKSGPEEGKTASAYVPALLAWAYLNGIPKGSLPITLAMVEAAEAEDRQYTNHSYERGHDVLADMIATVERRVPGDVTIAVRGAGLSITVAVAP